MFIGILIHAIIEKRLFKKELWGLSINLIIAFLGVHIIFSVFFSFNLLQHFLYVLKYVMNFHSTYERGYWIWIVENLKEFSFGVGIPVMIIFIYMTAHIFNEWKTLINNIHWSSENVYMISLLVTFLVVVSLGINRGEIMRLWIYLAVFFQVPASIFMAKLEKGEILFFLVAGTLMVQTIITLHRVGFVIP